jgi:hypothetical protein
MGTDMNPRADDVATAIVTACRITGEDPLFVGGGGRYTGGKHSTHNRARHYAMHALRAVFPHVSHVNLARMVGCPGYGGHFWHNSVVAVAHPTGTGKIRASWWSTEAYQSVVDAVKAIQPHEPEPKPVTAPDLPKRHRRRQTFATRHNRLMELPSAAELEKRNGKGDVEEEPDHGPVFDRTPLHETKRDPYMAPSKAEIYEVLRRAAANTKPRADE